MCTYRYISIDTYRYNAIYLYRCISIDTSENRARFMEVKAIVKIYKYVYIYTMLVTLLR